MWECELEVEETGWESVPGCIPAVSIFGDVPHWLSISNLHCRLKVWFTLRGVLLR